jgi:hypothetical protein
MELGKDVRKWGITNTLKNGHSSINNVFKGPSCLKPALISFHKNFMVSTQDHVLDIMEV